MLVNKALLEQLHHCQVKHHLEAMREGVLDGHMVHNNGEQLVVPHMEERKETGP